jgi:hypothetical protein
MATLEKERNSLEAHRNDLLKQDRGKFVVIGGE